MRQKLESRKQGNSGINVTSDLQISPGSAISALLRGGCDRRGSIRGNKRPHRPGQIPALAFKEITRNRYYIQLPLTFSHGWCLSSFARDPLIKPLPNCSVSWNHIPHLRATASLPREVEGDLALTFLCSWGVFSLKAGFACPFPEVSLKMGERKE